MTSMVAPAAEAPPATDAEEVKRLGSASGSETAPAAASTPRAAAALKPELAVGATER